MSENSSNWRSSEDVIRAAQTLVQNERAGRYSASAVINHITQTLKLMSENPTINTQLHDNLYKHLNSKTRTGMTAKALMSFGKKCSVSNVDLEYEASIFIEKGIVGIDPESDDTISIPEFVHFYTEMKKLTFPDR